MTKIIGAECEPVLIMPTYDKRNIADWRLDMIVTYEDYTIKEVFRYMNSINMYDAHTAAELSTEQVMKLGRIPSSWSM